MKNQFVCFLGRSLIVKKNDGIKESTDSQATIDDEDTRGRFKRGKKKNSVANSFSGSAQLLYERKIKRKLNVD